LKKPGSAFFTSLTVTETQTPSLARSWIVDELHIGVTGVTGHDFIDDSEMKERIGRTRDAKGCECE